MDQESVTKLHKMKKKSTKDFIPAYFGFNINNLKSTNLSRVGISEFLQLCILDIYNPEQNVYFSCFGFSVVTSSLLPHLHAPLRALLLLTKS